MMKKCVYCGAIYLRGKDEEKSCPHCGGDLVHPAEYEVARSASL